MNNIQQLFCSKDEKIERVIEIFEDSKKWKLPTGIALVVNDNNQLIGTTTDGDLRRGLYKYKSFKVCVEEIMEKDPIYFKEGVTTIEILESLPDKLKKRNRYSKKILNKVVLVSENRVPTRIIEYSQLLEQKVATHRHIAILGLGYVGLTLALVMADRGYNVTGVEINEEKAALLKSGTSYIHEIGLPEILRERINKNFFVETEIPDYADVYIISVGTPIEKLNGSTQPKPILTYLEQSVEMIAKKLKRGDLIILRSTVPIGTSRDYVLKKIEEKTSLKCGIDFHLSFAPERTLEGKAIKELTSLPQIIGGYDQDSVEATVAVFRELTPTTVRVESLEAAEMCKLINNTFRDYVFAYSNQLSLIASEFNIDAVKTIKAANEGYPRNTVPLPSPGVGGPCLTKDPYIFNTSIKKHATESNIFTQSRQINDSMHQYTFDRVMNELRLINKDPKNSNVLICGLAFKGYPETGDIRNSTSIEILKLFNNKVKNIYGFDAVSSIEDLKEVGINYFNIYEGFHDIDVVMFLNNHKSFDKLDVFEMTRELNENPIIFDGWHTFRSEDFTNTRPCTYINLSFKQSSI
jgi:UDP-N-acetyl-D-mannosaminuronic acid dehydrogenase